MRGRAIVCACDAILLACAYASARVFVLVSVSVCERVCVRRQLLGLHQRVPPGCVTPVAFVCSLPGTCANPPVRPVSGLWALTVARIDLKRFHTRTRTQTQTYTRINPGLKPTLRHREDGSHWHCHWHWHTHTHTGTNSHWHTASRGVGVASSSWFTGGSTVYTRYFTTPMWPFSHRDATGTLRREDLFNRDTGHPLAPLANLENAWERA